jgi:phosphodiesterase/alkaline phosphatase D-like protein
MHRRSGRVLPARRGSHAAAYAFVLGTLAACGGEASRTNGGTPTESGRRGGDAGTTAPKPDDNDAREPLPDRAGGDAGESAVTGPDAAADADRPALDPTTSALSERFPLGVASGDALPGGALLWARYTGSDPLELAVWPVRADGRLGAEAFRASVPSGDFGYVGVEVDGLRAATTYRYAFFETDGAGTKRRSAVGRFRTALAEDALDVVRVGALSCTKNVDTMPVLVTAGRRDDLDAFLLLGDTSYNDGASTLGEFREKWARTLGSRGYVALRSSTSLIATWDDHEIDNNWNPETIPKDKREAGTRAFFEAIPMRPTAPSRVWRSLRWGRTVEFFVLDSRGERRPSSRRSEAAEYISPAQLAWLKAGLSASPAVFKVILNSVPISNIPVPAEEQDRWEGFASQRTEILSYIDAENIRGVLWVAGDFHVATAGRVSTSGAGQNATELLVGPGAQTPTVVQNFLTGVMRAPQFDWNTSENNYAELTFEPQSRSVRVRYVGADGNALAGSARTLRL